MSKFSGSKFSESEFDSSQKVSRETFESKYGAELYKKLDEFRDLLLKWNKKINLISKNTLNSIFDRHILDSLQILEYIPKESEIIDLGSGGGFPGIILSLAGIQQMTLIESDSRKTAFLLQAASLCEQKIDIINERVENIEGLSCDVITSRGFASLDNIFKLSEKISVKDKFLLHKGASYTEELASAEKHWLFKVHAHDSITSDQGKILEISNLVRL